MKKRLLVIFIAVVLIFNLAACSVQPPEEKEAKAVESLIENIDSKLGQMISIDYEDIIRYIKGKSKLTYVITGIVKEYRNVGVGETTQHRLKLYDGTDKYNTISCFLKLNPINIKTGQTVSVKGNINFGNSYMDDCIIVSDNTITEDVISFSFNQAQEYFNKVDETFIKTRGLLLTEINDYSGEVYGKLYANKDAYEGDSYESIRVYFTDGENPKNGEYVEVVGKLSGSWGALLSDCVITERGASVRKQIE